MPPTKVPRVPGSAPPSQFKEYKRPPAPAIKRLQDVDKVLRPHEIAVKDLEREDKIRALDLHFNRLFSDEMEHRKKHGLDASGLWLKPFSEVKPTPKNFKQEPSFKYFYDCMFHVKDDFRPRVPTLKYRRPDEPEIESEERDRSENTIAKRWQHITMGTEQRAVAPNKVTNFKYLTGSDGVIAKQHTYTPTNSKFIYLLDDRA